MRNTFWAHRATTPPNTAAARTARWLLPLLGASAVIGVVAAFAGWPWQWLVAVWLLLPLAAWRWGARGRFPDLGLRGPRTGFRTLGLGAAVVCAVTLAGLAVSLAVGWHTVEAADLAADERAGRLASVLLAGVLLAGVGEELAYRGSVLRLAAAWRGPAVAVGASAVLFAAAHTPNLVAGQGLAGAALGTRLLILGVVGVGLGYAAWRTGGLWLAIGWHAGSNLVHGLVDSWWVIEPAGPTWWSGRQPGIFGAGGFALTFTFAEVAVLCWLAGSRAPFSRPRRRARGGRSAGREPPGAP